MAVNKNVKRNFHYNNIEKKDKNFMYQNLEKSNCYNCNFAGSNFDYVNFRGAHFKSSSFMKCSFKWSEFIGTNFRKSNFKNAIFENTIFDSVKLQDVDFKDAKFINTIFVSTDISKAKNLDINNPEIRIFDEMPKIEISEELKNAAFNTFNNKYIKASRILDTKDGDLNYLNIMILLENFNEETLIKGLNYITNELDRDFYTLSYIIKLIKNMPESEK
ncbi:pentapeptide repeat-containing protein [Clostridium tertium]|uniref:pentapeptide repeat-containing protein n=1 Tax=Clostridium tertium TaxID=1559 RepID=UPI0024B335CB|nr:pentapeptide repeat-containing protein [Clostridium tertium]MDI9216681.1 pentapeptide repeat-containing protein [Clostridium tertium]